MAERFYLCIDLKSFFASVEAVDRGLDPFTTNLVVADPSRGRGSVCLAITPAMKALGIRNRCRVFEIPRGVEYITAMPRMTSSLNTKKQQGREIQQKKRTEWCVLKRVAFVGMPRRVKSPRFPMVSDS